MSVGTHPLYCAVFAVVSDAHNERGALLALHVCIVRCLVVLYGEHTNEGAHLVSMLSLEHALADV